MAMVLQQSRCDCKRTIVRLISLRRWRRRRVKRAADLLATVEALQISSLLGCSRPRCLWFSAARSALPANHNRVKTMTFQASIGSWRRTSEQEVLKGRLSELEYIHKGLRVSCCGTVSDLPRSLWQEIYSYRRLTVTVVISIYGPSIRIRDVLGSMFRT